MLKYYHVYAKATCPWCVKAINLLHEQGCEFALTLVDNAPEFYHKVKKRYEWETVPMIVETDFVGNEKFIGGFTDLKDYFAEVLDVDIKEDTEVAPDLSE
jgi:glutaredoxin